jgi:hypothetical protein
LKYPSRLEDILITKIDLQMKVCRDVDRFKLTLGWWVNGELRQNGTEVSGCIKFAENLVELVLRFYTYDRLQQTSARFVSTNVFINTYKYTK